MEKEETKEKEVANMTKEELIAKITGLTNALKESETQKDLYMKWYYDQRDVITAVRVALKTALP
jgi:hypothetical protein